MGSSARVRASRRWRLNACLGKSKNRIRIVKPRNDMPVRATRRVRGVRAAVRGTRVRAMCCCRNLFAPPDHTPLHSNDCTKHAALVHSGAKRHAHDRRVPRGAPRLTQRGATPGAPLPTPTSPPAKPHTKYLRTYARQYLFFLAIDARAARDHGAPCGAPAPCAARRSATCPFPLPSGQIPD